MSRGSDALPLFWCAVTWRWSGPRIEKVSDHHFENDGEFWSMAFITTHTSVLAKCFVGNGRRESAAPGRVGVAGSRLFSVLAIALFILCSRGFVTAGGGEEECRDPAAPAGPSPSDGQTGRRTRTSLQWGERETIQRKVVYGEDDRQDVYQLSLIHI